MLPWIQPAVVSLLEQLKSVGQCAAAECVWTPCWPCSERSHCSAAVAGLAARLSPHLGDTDSAPKAAIRDSPPAAAIFPLPFFFSFVQPLHKCLNGWDRSIWKKNRLGGERPRERNFLLFSLNCFYCRTNCDVMPWLWVTCINFFSWK